jgi:hypothetical protein
MKKELLIASALVSSMGLAGVAQAATATFSGNHRVGIDADDGDAAVGTRAALLQSSFAVSVSETTDGGITISSGFDVAEESSNGAGGGGSSGLTLAFTDGSKLDLVSAGNASGSHDISVPGSDGEEGVTVTSTNTAPTGLDFATGTTAIGFEYHTAADFMMDGFKASLSYSTDTGATKTASPEKEGHWAVGGTYVTTAGDTTVTLGAGLSMTDWENSGTEASNDENSTHIGISAVTGDLTVAVGFADGDRVGKTANYEASANVMKAGVKYVTGDMTFNLGVVAGESKDSTTLGTPDTEEDSYDKTSASVTYAVASGVTAILGFSDVDSQDEDTVVDTGSNGSAWYIGANISF